MTKVISYANVQIRYNADTSGLKAHRTDLAAITRLIRANENEGEKFIRRIETLSKVAATGGRDQEFLAKGTRAAVHEFIRGAVAADRYEEALEMLKRQFPMLTNEAQRFAATLKNVNRTQAPTKSATSDLLGIAGATTPLGSLTVAAAGTFIAQESVQFIKDSINAYADMRGELVKLEVMLGSVEQAERSYAEFRGIAVKASLESKAVTAAALTLAQFGVATNKLTPTMRQLSVMAAGNSERLQSLALAFAQVTAAGRLTGQESLQFVNAGFSPLAEIARVTGIEMSVLRKRMEEGKISIQDVANSLITATEAGGRFYGMADKLSRDLPGQIAALKDEFLKLQQVTGEFFVETGGWWFMDVLRQMLVETRETVQLIAAIRDDIFSSKPYVSMDNTLLNFATSYADIMATIVKESDDAAASAEKAKKAANDMKRSQGVSTGDFWTDAISQATSFGEQIWEGLNKTREQMQKDVQTVRDAVKPQQMTAEMMSGIADRLAFLVQNFGLAQEDAIKYLAGLQEESKKTNTELPQRIAYGTKQAYEMSVKAQNDIQTKQLHKQEEQLREQKATNEILRRLNMPQMGIVT